MILTEDSGSGYKIFKEFFCNVLVQSAHSKSEIVQHLVALNNKYKRVLVVYDAAAFGMQIKKFMEVADKVKFKLDVLDWYSFEHHVLAQQPFNIWIDPESLNYTVESLEQYAFDKLTQLVKYSKRKETIKPCLTKDGMCKECDRVAYCPFVHNGFELGITLTDVKEIQCF